MQANPSTTVVCFPYLTPEECDEVLADLDEGSWTPGRIAHPLTSSSADEHEVRKCALNEQLAPELLERLRRDLTALNDRVHGFELSGFDDGDPVCAMRYKPGDHFEWHIDNGAGVPPFNSRKLSFSIQLTRPDAYEGGDLEMAMYSQAYGESVYAGQRQQARAHGSLILFPSFHLHRVSPVERGTRVALVGWLHGPPFR